MRSDELIADRYRLVRQIGSGGMGIVWLAFDEQEQREIALKRPLSAGGAIRADLEREAEIARKVAHPNAIEVLGVVGAGDDCWLAMEYFPSESLATVLSRRTLAPLEVAAIGVQVAGALAAAHAAEVVHRDITPGNILLAEDGTAKVTDFGISAWRAATITSSGKISGTVAYVSPEVADGDGAKAPSDVFSFGATLFAAVEGGPPFGSGHPAAILTRIRDARGEPVRRAGPLAPVLSALLQRERHARPTAEQAREMLARVADGQTVPEWTPQATARRRRRALLVSLTAVAVVAILVAGAIWLWPDPPAGPARTVLGDPRTADPCALADAEVFTQFGSPELSRDYGGLNRCDVLIEVGDATVDVAYYWDGPDEDEQAGASGTVDRQPTKRDDADCVVPITLADRSVVDIVAEEFDPVDLDLCEVASVAADHAMGVLDGLGEIPRLPNPPADSVAHIDACSLLNEADLATVPGFAAARPDPGFASWSCRWQSENAALQVVFDRNDPSEARAGRPIDLGGREAYVEEEGYGDGTCAVLVFHRQYRDANGEPHAELALVVVEGEPPMDQLCALASSAAPAVAQRLPRL